jgi:hypothetical protein
MSTINRIRQAIREGRFSFTDHTLEEAEADGLWLEDVIDVLLNGEIDSTYEDDPRGTRYVVRGDMDDLEVDVVCRFDRRDRLVIITVYVVN